MNEQRFLRSWYVGLGVAAGIVAAVAALLLTLIGTARGILANAGRALELANQIVTNTRPIWEIERTNAVAAQILDRAAAVETHATDVADAVAPPASAAAAVGVGPGGE